MKKVYLSVFLCFFAIAGFGATWYSQNTGDASDLENWNSLSGGGGSTPVSFATVGDVWIMQNSMSSLAELTIGGSLTVSNVYFTAHAGALTIGQDLTLTGGAAIDATGTLAINIGGNLSITGTSYIVNNPAYTTIVFNNTLSTLASPQTITWTSTAPGEWAEMNINAGCVVQLLSNVTLPPVQNAADTVYGTLVCGNFVLDCNTSDYPFVLTSGASLYTANPGGVDASVLNDYGFLYDAAANYVFNGSVPQVTGSLMPGSFAPGGSATVNNNAGVSLSQNTEFTNGSTLALTNGNLTIDVYGLRLGVSSTLSGTFSSTTMIVACNSGMVRKDFDEEGSFFFPIGDTSGNYTPIAIQVTGGTYTGGFVDANVTKQKHPNNANTNDYLNRFWTVNTSGDLNYSVTSATYVPGDVTGTEANISAGQYTCGLPWVKFGATNTVTHALSTTVVNNSASAFTGISSALPSATLTPSTAVCAGSSASLSVLTLSGDAPLSFSWSPSGTLSSATDTTVIATPGSITTYTLTVTDGNGFTGTATTSVSVNPLPISYEITGSGTYCSSLPGRHIGLSWSDTGIRYQLYLNDTVLVGAPLNGVNDTLDFGLDTAGIYTVVATDTTTGCTSVMEGFAIVTAIPTVVPTVTILPSIADTICEGTLVSFSYDETFGGEPSLQWSVNGTPISSFTPTYSYVPVNGDVVSIRMISSATCAIPDTVTASLTLSVSHHMTPTVYISVSPNDTVCEGTGVTITAAPTFGGTAPSYLWIKNTLPVDSTNSYSFIPANGDDVYCIMQSNYFCRTTTNAYSNVVAMTVLNPATSIPAVDIIALRGTSIGRNKPDTLVAVVTNGGVSPSSQWYINGAFVPGATTAVYIKTSFNNKDSVSCMVTRNDACGMATFNSVVILVSSVGVAQTGAAGDVKLMPNPNKGTFSIKGSTGATVDENVAIEITDLLGQVVYRNTVVARNGNIDEQVSLNNTVANGTYLLNLRSESGNTTLRFVVEQ